MYISKSGDAPLSLKVLSTFFLLLIFLFSGVAWGQIQISEPAVSNIRHNRAEIEWTTNLPSHGYVSYGRSKQLDGKVNILKAAKGHKVLLKKLKSGSHYFFKIVSKDKKGQVSISTIYSFKTEPFEVSTNTKLKLTSLPQATATSATQATISWETNKPSTSIVIYGVKGRPKTYVSTLETKVHIVLLEGLAPNTRYFYEAKSKSTGNQLVSSTYSSFLTPRAKRKHQLPWVKSGPSIARRSTNLIKVEWSTDRPCKSYIKWGKIPLPSFQQKKNVSSKNTKFHTFSLPELLGNTRYYYTIYLEDANGNKNNTEIFSIKTAGNY